MMKSADGWSMTKESLRLLLSWLLVDEWHVVGTEATKAGHSGGDRTGDLSFRGTDSISTSGKALASSSVIVSTVTVVFRERRLGATSTRMICLHAATDGLRRDTLSYLDIWFLKDQTGLNVSLWTDATKVGGLQPASVSVSESVQSNLADTSCVVATVAGTKANTPSSLFPKELVGCSDWRMYRETHTLRTL